MSVTESKHDLEFDAVDIKAEEDEVLHDASLISWDGDTDHNNPQNWPNSRKWIITATLSGFSALPPLSSTILAPAQFALKQDLGLSSDAVLEACLSVFNIGVGLGPLVMSPLSETYGRYPVVIIGNAFFLAWNTGCGFADSKAAFIVCRIFTGFGSAASLSVMAATMGDIWPAHKRATAIGLATFFPLLGPAIGPIIGGYVTEYASWRWILWATSIANAVWMAIGIFTLHETYAPALLRKKAKHARKTTGDSRLHSAYDDEQTGLFDRLRKGFSRPYHIFVTQTVVQITCVLLIVLYGTMFLNFYSFPVLWTTIYQQSTATGSLNYISTAVGCVLGSQVLSRMNDALYKYLKRQNDGQGKPELRLPLLLFSSSLVGIGLVILGWTGQYRCHWIAPNIGNAIFLTGAIGTAQLVQTYTVDAYTIFAASAGSTQNFLRSLASFGFPLFAPAMYARLGWGGSSTLLGLGTAVVGLAAAASLWTYGPYLRERQKLA